MIMKEIRKAEECKIPVCHGNVSFYLFGLTVGETWWEPQEQNCETLRLFPSAPLFAIPLHLQPYRTCSRAEKSFMLYLLLFILVLHIFSPGFHFLLLTCWVRYCMSFPLLRDWRAALPLLSVETSSKVRSISGGVMGRIGLNCGGPLQTLYSFY